MHRDTHAQSDEYTLPCVEALLAGTLALMTGHVQANDNVQRLLMANKISHNLFSLQHHPGLTPEFGLVLARLQKAWQQLAGQSMAADASCPATGLWHGAAVLVQ